MTLQTFSLHNDVVYTKSLPNCSFELKKKLFVYFLDQILSQPICMVLNKSMRSFLEMVCC